MELQKILDQAQKELTPQMCRFNQCKGMTEALRELDAEAKKNGKRFDIIAASVVVATPRIDENGLTKYFDEYKEAVIEAWVEFIMDDKLIYIQLDDNPFFDNMIISRPILTDDKGTFTFHNYYAKGFEAYENIECDELYRTVGAYAKIKENLVDTIKSMGISERYREKHARKNYISERIYTR